jgi:drug/metabolite transporter (DMT)-like permease
MAPRTVDYLLLGLLALLWGSSYALIKLAAESITPLTIAASRVTLAALLLAWAWRPRGLPWGAMLMQALLNSVLPWTLLAWAASRMDSSLAAVLNSTSPLFVFLITWAITRHEPATRRKLAGVLLGLAGVIAIMGTGGIADAGRHRLAELACLAGAACYALAAVFGRRFDRLPATATAAGSMVCAAAILVPVSLMVEQPWSLAPSVRSIAALAGLAVFSTALALVLYFHLLPRIGSIAVASQSYLRIVVGVALGALLLGEQPDAAAWVGTALVLAGVAFMTAPQRKGTRVG